MCDCQTRSLPIEVRASNMPTLTSTLFLVADKTLGDVAESVKTLSPSATRIVMRARNCSGEMSLNQFPKDTPLPEAIPRNASRVTVTLL